MLCGSPALRGLPFCYFHERWRRIRPHRRPGDAPRLQLPLLEDANAIQMALQQVMQAILDNQIDNKRAGLLLYALQTASANLKRTDFESFKLKDQANAGDAVEYLDQDEPEEACSAPEDTAKVESAPVERKPVAAVPAQHQRPLPEHDAELTDEELIKAIRSLAGIT